MTVYKKRLISKSAYGNETYQYYKVDITDYAFISYWVIQDKKYQLGPFVQSFITGEFEILYVRDPYHDKYMELCSYTGRVLGTYWERIYRSV
jgi:hypothetical protein